MKKKVIISTIVFVILEYFFLYNLFAQKMYFNIVFALVCLLCYGGLISLIIKKSRTQVTTVDESADYGDVFCDTIKLVGVTYDCSNTSANRQDIIAKLEMGDTLQIKKYLYNNEPAIMVLTDEGIDIGNFSKADAKKYYNYSIDASVDQVIGGIDGKSYGCVISIDLEK